MFKRLVLFLLALNLAVAIGVRAYEDHVLEVSAWDIMCEILVDKKFKYNCGDIERPPVAYMKMDEQGRYKGDGLVEINRRLPKELQEGVLVHEYVHYLHQQLGQVNIPGMPPEICLSEFVAFYIQGVYNEWGDRYWWVDYRYCWNMFADRSKLPPFILGQ